MPTLSLTSRTGRALGLRLYRGSAPEAHDHARDRLIPTRQTASEGTELLASRMRVEVQRQELRRVTRRAVYPLVVVLSLGVLAIPAAIQAYDSYNAQRNQRIFEEIQQKNQMTPEEEAEWLNGIREDAERQRQQQQQGQPSSGVMQPPTTTGPPANPFGSEPFPESSGGGFPEAPGADAARHAIEEGR